MPNQKASDCLTKLPANEFTRIMFEASGLKLEDRLTALYLRALKPDCFEHYKPRSIPHEPQGWREDYERYLEVEREDRPEAWRRLQKKYSGYLKARENAESDDASNLGFLKQMEAHFLKVGIFSKAEICREIINEFRENLVTT